jgi:phage recombination protein Bet
MTKIATRQTDNGISQFEPVAGARRELLKRTICRDLTDDEMDLFVAVCNRRRLDPFVRQIHAVKRRQWNAKLNDGKGGYEEVMVIQTGIDGFRLIAERTHERDGVEGPWWCGPDGEWRDVWLTGSWPAAAKVIVYRKGHTRGYPGIAHWEEYVQTYKDKQGNIQPVQMWQSMPAGQLAKCAEALASRKAFPEELGGIYTDEEMGQAEEGPIAGAVTTTPAPAMAATGSVPTLDDIKQIRTVRDAKEVIQSSTPAFQALVPRAISATYHTDPHQWWDNAKNVADWRLVLEYAIELGDYEQHEMSGAGNEVPPAGPAPDPTSPSAQVTKGKGDQAGGDDPQGGS